MNSTLFPDAEQLSDAKILMVDDEQAHIRVLEWALKQAGFKNFKSLTDSSRAREEFIALQPDLVLLDLNMPQPDGLEVLQQFRQSSGPDEFIPVLILTGDNTADSRARALAAGANDFLPKPIDYTEVMLRIRNLLQTRFLYRQTREMKQQIDALSRRTTKE